MKVLKGIVIAVIIMIIIYVIAYFALGKEWFDHLFGEESAMIIQTIAKSI